MPGAETLATLGSDFRRIATTNSGSVEVMSQYTFKDLIGWDVGVGTCHGLSIMWLAFRHTPTMGTTLFDELLGGKLSPASHKALTQFTNRMHSAQGTKFEADKTIGEERTKKVMKEFSLAFVEKKLFGGGWGKGHTDLGSYIAGNPGYYIVDIPGHAMAACSARGLPAFYDPNIGEATFLNGSVMGKFFSEYFKSTVMKRNYSVGGGKVQVTTHRFS